MEAADVRQGSCANSHTASKTITDTIVGVLRLATLCSILESEADPHLRPQANIHIP
jgi:hypothetical protein